MTVISYHSEESVSQIQNDVWQNVAQVTIDVADGGAGEYIIWVSCEYAGVNLDEIIGIRLLLDTTEVALDHFSPVLSDEFRAFSSMGLKNLTSGLYYLTLQARCLDATQTMKVRRKRLLVMKH